VSKVRSFIFSLALRAWLVCSAASATRALIPASSSSCSIRSLLSCRRARKASMPLTREYWSCLPKHRRSRPLTRRCREAIAAHWRIETRESVSLTLVTILASECPSTRSLHACICQKIKADF